MLQMLLPGTAVVYNGDELGMEDTFIRWDQSVDPPALIAGPRRYKEFTRDPERTPFQWDDTENSGNDLHFPVCFQNFKIVLPNNEDIIKCIAKKTCSNP